MGAIADVLAGIGLSAGAINVIFALLKALIIVLFVLLNVLFLIWLERKVSGHIQNRMGPMRVGWHGALQTLADTLKLLTKEDVVPAAADRLVFALAPILIFAPALMVYVILPFGPTLIVRDLNIAVVYVAAVASFSVISILMAGWSSNNKWSLLGAMRSAAQLISYEVPLVLSIVAVVMMTGTMSVQGIVRWQTENYWTIFVQIIGFVVFLVASIAELNRAPFDLPEAESELVAGYFTEYSGMRWSIFMLAEYASLVSASALAASLYFGGWGAPFGLTFLPPVVWFLLKTYFFIFLAMWIRWTLPRVRVDHLMEMGWKGLIPLSLVNLIITGIYVIAR